jgi:hypothetical protein
VRLTAARHRLNLQLRGTQAAELARIVSGLLSLPRITAENAGCAGPDAEVTKFQEAQLHEVPMIALWVFPQFSRKEH